MKGSPAVPGSSLTSKPTWSKTSGFSTTSAFFVSASPDRRSQTTARIPGRQWAASCTRSSTDRATAFGMTMHDMTRMFNAIEQGDPHAAEQLLPLVYDELRKLAAQRLSKESPGQTLQATALVHEAYLRLVDVERAQHFNSRGHFFASAAEAMRRLLVENARSKAREKRGGDWHRVDFEELDVVISVSPEQLVALDDALARLAALDPLAGKLVNLRYFAGMA